MKSNRVLFVFFMTMLLISTTVAMVIMVHMASADPATLIYVSQSVISGKVPPNTFRIDVNVTDAPTTYAWEVHVTWDPNTLELAIAPQEGEFLRRGGTVGTALYTYPATYTEANVKGEITVSCTMTNPLDLWATGNGHLFWLGFRVKASGSTLINLFDTFLVDHLEAGSPAPTLYPNSDCFFYSSSPSHDISGRPRYITLINASAHVGEVAKINVTVLNEGTETEPSVTINVYANGTFIGSTTLSVSGTGNFENRKSTYTVEWNTAGFAVGKYNITASVPAVSGEVDTADNNFMGEQQVKVLPLGDINRDGVVDSFDLASLAQAYGSTSTVGENWNPIADINKDNKVEVADLYLLGKDYGENV